MAVGSGDDKFLKLVRAARSAIVHGLQDQFNALEMFAGHPGGNGRARGSARSAGRQKRNEIALASNLSTCLDRRERGRILWEPLHVAWRT